MFLDKIVATKREEVEELAASILHLQEAEKINCGAGRLPRL